MRQSLIKRRTARIMAFVLIFLMTAQPFCDVNIYADENTDQAVNDQQELTEPEEVIEETAPDTIEEAAGETTHHIRLLNKAGDGCVDEFDIPDGYDIISFNKVPSSPQAGQEVDNERFKYWYTTSVGTPYDFSAPVTGDLDIRQHWVNIFTIDFNSMGGSAVSSQVIEANVTPVVRPNPDPVREKYRFDNWYKNDTCTNLYTFGNTENSSFTLYAGWIRIYNVKFIGNGGDVTEPSLEIQQIEEGSCAVSPNATRNGHDFLGWYDASSGGNKWNQSVSVNRDMILYAHWAEQPRTITFRYEKANGDFVKEQVKNTFYGKLIAEPDPPADEEGWEFKGWYDTVNEIKWNFATTRVNESITLHPKFEKIKYTAKFKCDSVSVQGATQTPSDKPNLDYGTKIPRPDPDPKHTMYDFTGWYRDEACTEPWDFNKNISANDATNGIIWLYAGWKMKTFTVSFNTNGGTAVSDQTVNIGAKVAEPVTDRDGYKLKYWCSDPALKNRFDFNTGVFENKWLYAFWEEAHVVSFNTAPGTPIPSIKVVSGNKLKRTDIPTTTYTGYKLKDWYTTSACEAGDEYDFEQTVDVDLELYAAWEKEKYTVKFESVGSILETQEVYYQDKVTRPAQDPQRTGFDFLGWYENKSCTIPWNFDTHLMPPNDVTIYAGWGPVMLTVSFDSMSSDAVVTPSVNTVSYGSLLPQPSASRTGYTLDGWYKSTSFLKSEKWDFSNDIVTEGGWLYANWLVRKCTVTFDTDGGSSIPSQIVIYGDTVSVSTIPVKAGCRFKGWYKNSNRTIKYDFSSPVISDITIYAGWETAPSYKLTAVASPSTYGNIDPRGTFSVKESSSQKFTFIPKSGYEAYLLKIDGVETAFTGNSYVLESISKNHTVTVYFREIPVVKHIISAASADPYGMISPSGEVPVVDGTDQKFYLDPIDGYMIDYLEVDGAVVTISSDSYTFKNVKEPHTITAHFKKYEPPAPAGHAKVKFIVDGEVIQTEIVSLGQIVKRPYDPEKDGHIFMGWYDGNWKWNFSDAVEKDLTLTAKFISETVSVDDVHSGMDKEMDLSDPDDITMVKGQSYDFGPGIWASSNTQIITIKKKTGVAKAKNPSNVPVTLTNTAVNPAREYKVKVVAPELSSKKLTMGVGSVQKISVLYSGGLNIAWMSSNPKIASVDDGTITSTAKGKANIYAYLNGMKYTCKVTVSDKYTAPSSFDDVYAFTLRPSQTLDLKSIAVKGVKPNKLDWRLSDESGTKDLDKTGWLAWDDGIVRINVNGKLRAKSCGSSIIVGKSGDTRVKTIKVTVDTIPTKTETYINVGKSEKLTYYKVNNKKAQWSATNEGSIVLLGSSAKTMGTVYGLNVGTSVVSCSYNGMEYSTKVHVEDPGLSTEDPRIGRTGNNEYLLTLRSGTRFVTDLEDVSQRVTWKSKDNKIAFVDENGIIEGRKTGKTTITAKINGTNVKIKVFVTQ